MAGDSEFDMDAVRAAHVDEVGEIPWRTMKLYDREWRVSYEANLIGGLEMISKDGNLGQFNFLMGWIHPEERADFVQALYADPYLDGDLLGKITDFLMNNVAARPTTPPVPSPGGSQTTGQAPKDASSTEAVPAVSAS